MMHEAATHESNSFITLTYDESNLPKDMSLDVTHWQKFMKRLRKKLGPTRFYHCGEYGGKFGRPHYHAILFGQDFSADRKRIPGKGNPRYTSGTLQDLWGMGATDIGEVNHTTTNYVAGYITKKITGPLAEDHYQGRKPEYSTMSRRPGIGAGYLEQWGDQLFPRDETIVKGKPVQLPDYYMKRAEKLFPEMVEEMKKKRRTHFNTNPSDNTPERLAVRGEVRERINNQFTREPDK